MDIPYRQIHLDFHTSPVTYDVGKDFDTDDFAQTLKDAHVNSINIFAKCHHGMCYYPTKAGVVHPALKFDLLGSMIKSLHACNIQCPVYYPLGWEENAALHEDWLELGSDGVPGKKLPDDAGYYRWKKLCLNNPDYKSFIKLQLKELIESYEIDGFWFDIIFQLKCTCPVCRAEMLEMGLNPEDERDVAKHDELALQKLQKELNEFVASFGKDIPTFYNSSWRPDGGYSDYTISTRAKMQSHMEIESLPSGEWGYNHFPLFVNFHNKNNNYTVGMNGKFHLSWGDHGSLKNQEALEFECFRMISNGCACSVGDQLHPRGVMNKAAYNRIGRVFGEIEKLEPWLNDSKKFAEVAVVNSTDFFIQDTTSDEGVMRMLMELHIPFDFIQLTDSLDKYKLVILPDEVKISEDFSLKLSSYLANGGHILATNHSADETSMGIKILAENEFCPSYAVIDEDFCKESLASSDKLINEKPASDDYHFPQLSEHEDKAHPYIEPLEYVFYEPGVYVESSLPVKSYIGKPYFNRTADCFSSHRHFPFEKTTDYPAVLLNGKIGYCAYPIFRDYMINGNRIYRDIFATLLNSLLPAPIIKTDAPTCSEITVREQAGRTLVHVLSYIAERRTRTIDVIDTRLPLYNIKLALREAEPYTNAYCVRTGEKLPIIRKDGYAYVSVPCIDGYEIVAFDK